MSGRIKALIALILVSAMASGCIAAGDASDAGTGFTVTDSTGKTFSYSAPSDKIIVTGYAATLTLIDAEMASKIFAVDQYGAVAFDDRDLDRPRVYNFTYGDTSGFKSSLIGAAAAGFDKDSDTVILTTYKTDFVGSDGTSGLRRVLMDEGFRYVPFYGSIYSYSEVVSCVQDLERISGSTAGLTASMNAAYDSVTAAVAGKEKTDAVFLRYSSTKGWGIGVDGAIGATLIEAAGGNNVGASAGSSTVYNEGKIIELLSEYPDAVIFLDSPYFDTYGGSFGKFVSDVMGGDQGNHGLVKMLKTWNNYDPGVAEGLTAIAHVLHPDAVAGDVEPYYVGGTEGSNVLVYAVSALVVIAVIAGVMLFVRSRKRIRMNGRRDRVLLCTAAIIVILVLAVMLDLSWATFHISFGDVIDVLAGHGTWANNIQVEDNAQRVAIGALVGAGLAACGCVMQAVFRNPMASPYILGLSSGASLGAAVGLLFTIPFIPAALTTPVLAFATCMATMFLVYGVAHVGGSTHTETLLLTGIAISSMMSAVVSFLTFIAGDKTEDIVFWSMGSLSRADWEGIAVVAPMVFAGIAVMMCHTKSLNAIMIGDSHAMDLGIEVGRTRLIILIAATVVTAAAVSFVGAIGFVGLIIPHIFRIILGPDNRTLLPVSALGGAAFLILCDYLAHTVAPQYGVLPIGVLTALVGAPYFIYLLRRRRSEVGWS